MRKIWIILRSEYWRRVRTKSFILTTLLLPFGLILLMTAPGVIGFFAAQSGQTRIAVMDETGVLLDSLRQAGGEQLVFTAAEGPVDSVRAAVRAGTYDGYLVLPDSLLRGVGEARYYSQQGGGLATRTRLNDLLDDVVQQVRLARADTPPAVMSIIHTEVQLTSRQLTEEGTAADRSLIYMGLGWGIAFVIYMAVLLYGQYVMQGVIEEKNSRVVEIVVSSVRPFELMMGKVLGIGAMGLTQFVVWGVLLVGGASALGTAAGLLVGVFDIDLPTGTTSASIEQTVNMAMPDVSIGLLVWFILFFLGGYLLYASLFAAVGSAVENPQEAQGFVFPITMPLIVPILFLYFLIENPDAPVSVIMSLIPFFSPVLMVARIAVAAVPFWQIALSFLLLVGTFVGAIWVSGRIYRVGILMYGKKPSLRELLRWVTY